MLIEEIEKKIKRGIREGFLYPRYDGYSFYNIVPTIFSLFGKNFGKKTLPEDLFSKYINPNNKIIFFLIDGFGYDQFIKFSKTHFLKNFLKEGLAFPITSIFPSTTAAALTTLHSGLTPQEHGLLEWYLYIKEIDKVIQTLPFSPIGKNQPPEELQKEGVNPTILFEGETIHEKFNKLGIVSYLLIKDVYRFTSYSSLTIKGAKVISWSNFYELFASLLTIIAEEKGPCCCGVYLGNIDYQGHIFGPFSQEYTREVLSLFELFKEELLLKIKKGWIRNLIIVLTADHGQIAVDPSQTIYLNQYKVLNDNLAIGSSGRKIPPWGSPRDIFLSVRDDKLKEMISFLQKELNGDAYVLPSQEAFNNGLFGVGDPNKNFFNRLGNILILPKGNQTIWYEHVPGELFTFRGYHGGLSANEMLIPFAIANVSELLHPK